MSRNFVWAIDYHGSLFKLNLVTQEWSQVSGHKTNSRKDTYKRITTTTNCAWAICGDQNVYVNVFETDLPIKLQVNCYENERWSVIHGWGKKSLLYSDRWHWSSKDGTKKCERESVQVPSVAWSWSGDWYIDESIECDSEGWQYALDFPSTFYKQPGHLMFVRRRKWARHRVFVKFNQWIMVPGYSSNDPFQDITVGGYNLPGQGDGFLSLWAVTFSGKVLFRYGVSRLCPEGDHWIEVSTGEDINLVQISVGPSGMLWGCTWDGNVAVRKGISHAHPTGTSWDVIYSPAEDPLHAVEVGTRSIWALSKKAKVYFWRGPNSTSHTTSDSVLASAPPAKVLSSYWVEMVGFFTAIDVGTNDQVWVIDQENQQLYFRTNVTDDEPGGHEWKLFPLSDPFSESQPKHIFSISSGACDVDASYFERISTGRIRSCSSTLSLASNTDDLFWRNEILKCLCDRNSREMEHCGDGFELYSTRQTRSEWKKRGECLYLIDTVYDTWCKCHLKLQKGHGEDYDQQPVLFLYYMTKRRSYKEVVLPLTKVSCVHRLRYMSKPHVIGIEICENESKLNKVCLSMDSLEMLDEWLEVLNNQEEPVSCNKCTTLWATTYTGDVFKCDISDHLAVSAYKWRRVNGHLLKVVSGGGGITWGIGFDGKPYVYTGHLSPKETNQQNVEEHYIFENQRWNPIEGYAERLLPSDRWCWSDESGVYELSKQNYALPAGSRWIEEWSIDYHKGADEDGWQYAVDFPRVFHKHRGINDYVRRRKWKRSCIAQWSGPWQEIETDIKLIEVSMGMENVDDVHCCWVVSNKGDVMVRNGLTTLCPQGSSWTYVSTETPVVSLSVGHRSRVWCARKDGSCYLRAGFNENKTIGSDWLHVLKEETIIDRVFAGNHFILALDKTGKLYLRSAVSDIYPEGTQWEAVMDFVSDVSVNSQDQVYIIQGNELKLWINVDDGRFETCQLVTLLKVGWTGICNRTISRLENEQVDLESTQIDTENNDADVATRSDGLSVDPNSVDIYSYYSESSIDVYSLLDETSDSRVSIDC